MLGMTPWKALAQACRPCISQICRVRGGEGAKERNAGGRPAPGVGVAVAPAGLSTGGSQLGPRVVLQQCAHVQECLLQVVRQAGCVGLGAAVVGRHGEVDVSLHGVIANAIAIWDHGPKEHDTVCLGRDLETAQD